MLKKLIPDIETPSIHEIDTDALWDKGIRGVILDIDNTLESHLIPKPSEKTLAFLKKLEDKGFKICFISNGREERVKIFNEELNYFAMAKAGKPKKKGFLRAQELMNLKKEEIAMVGDQIFTDVFGAERCGFYTILVNPIESIENGFFYIKRFFEKGIRKRIKK